MLMLIIVCVGARRSGCFIGGTWQWEMGFPPEKLCCTDELLVKPMYEYNRVGRL
jgi:hypothetical protein